MHDIIATSTFRLDGTYLWVKAGAVRTPEKHLMVTRDATDISVATKAENLDDLDVLEVNRDRWTLLAIDISSPFYCVGLLATISRTLGDAGMDILVVSTYSRDWIFVTEAEAPRAAELMRGLGFKDG